VNFSDHIITHCQATSTFYKDY